MADDLYAPLRGPSSIRLLTLHPAARWRPVVASLSEVTLTDEPVYEVLSYTWGSSVDEKELSVNGVTVSIRHNLWSFLQRVRLKHAPRVIWVDAICISQTDNVEKSNQVAMIGQIVTNATRVLVWLGEHASNSKKLFESQGFYLEHSGTSTRPRLLPAVSEEEDHELWSTWVSLLERVYWTRTWSK